MFQTDQSATYFLRICSHFVQFKRRECESHKPSQADARKYKLFFLFSKIAVFLRYREIYISMYLRSSNSLHSILATVLCKKNEATLTQIPCFGAALDSNGTTWYGSANHT